MSLCICLSVYLRDFLGTDELVSVIRNIIKITVLLINELWSTFPCKSMTLMSFSNKCIISSEAKKRVRGTIKEQSGLGHVTNLLF